MKLCSIVDFPGHFPLSLNHLRLLHPIGTVRSGPLPFEAAALAKLFHKKRSVGRLRSAFEIIPDQKRSLLSIERGFEDRLVNHGAEKGEETSLFKNSEELSTRKVSIVGIVREKKDKTTVGANR